MLKNGVTTMANDDDFAYLYNPARDEWLPKKPIRSDGGESSEDSI